MKSLIFVGLVFGLVSVSLAGSAKTELKTAIESLKNASIVLVQSVMQSSGQLSNGNMLVANSQLVIKQLNNLNVGRLDGWINGLTDALATKITKEVVKLTGTFQQLGPKMVKAARSNAPVAMLAPTLDFINAIAISVKSFASLIPGFNFNPVAVGSTSDPLAQINSLLKGLLVG
ncbi:uncharacterized protein LOC129748593 [Uranotaenia lowii]|uniref:uncharacterized protein LOC129748593 n=1 Tax=Uranotaenia lowii TaxID=190385 RepID=UPI00247865DE|nr:uncharacterized protein LOC129748593 [Uranotaenia lowii]